MAREPFEWVRWLIAAGLAFVVLVQPVGAAGTELPRDPDTLVRMIETAIETRDYDTLDQLVLWKDAGEIKKRIVRFQLNRNLGRPIRSVTFEPFPANGMDAALATGRLTPNMEITNRVRVVFDEAAIEATGIPPTSVFLVGLHRGVYRIGLVNQSVVDDGD